MSLSQRAAARESAAAGDPLARLLALGRPLVMGILNVTPDSFSDGGRFIAPAEAVRRAQAMIAEGADILDIGAESTRPGASPVAADDEWQRLAPVLASVVALGTPVSIDTMKAEIAAKALAAGAAIVNDVWGLQRDPEMARVVAEADVPIVVMHNRTAVDPAIDILADIEAFFRRSLAIAENAGIRRERIVLDPGIGFGKNAEQSIAAIANLDRLAAFGLPLLMGLSRKRFVASVSKSEAEQRLGGSLAGNVLAVKYGANIVRVHDVAETVQALRVAVAIEAVRRRDD
ncbi:MAG TPA: dihydropteroate synthase [Xanthobacteraceae bacterium]